MWVHVLAEPVQDPQLPASIAPASTYGELHLGSSQVLICLRNLGACPIVVPAKHLCGESHSIQPDATGNPHNANLRRTCQWLLERLDPGQVKS